MYTYFVCYKSKCEYNFTIKNSRTNCKLIAGSNKVRHEGPRIAENCFHMDEQEYKRRTGTRRGSVRKLREKDGHNSILGPNVVTPPPKRTRRQADT